MTTSVTIVNNGPDRITVSAAAGPGHTSSVTLAPSEREDFFVYPGRELHIVEGAVLDAPHIDDAEKADGGSKGDSEEETHL